MQTPGCDHGNDDQVRALFQQVEQEQGQLDLLVNGDRVSPALRGGRPRFIRLIVRWPRLGRVKKHRRQPNEYGLRCPGVTYISCKRNIAILLISASARWNSCS
ncbi:hypothetical protein C7H09_01280 [Marinobacter fuscus]|uniref:Uncharacterized protein n=1 Tax=Marinobacter fuscus TaxID=2109942 RepID=A0A2T1KT43_9GAMM|nr:hypothetical protein C7H09_01280 [Marinobacter fuscus]